MQDAPTVVFPDVFVPAGQRSLEVAKDRTSRELQAAEFGLVETLQLIKRDQKVLNLRGQLDFERPKDLPAL